MTTIIAYKQEKSKNWLLTADRKITGGGYTYFVNKISKYKNIVAASSGPSSHELYFKHKVKNKYKPKKESLEKYIHNLINGFKEFLKEKNGLIKQEDGEGVFSGGNYLFAHKDQLVHVSSCFNVRVVSEPFFSIGSGSQLSNVIYEHCYKNDMSKRKAEKIISTVSIYDQYTSPETDTMEAE